MIKNVFYSPYYTVNINTETGVVEIFSSSGKRKSGNRISVYVDNKGYLKTKMQNRSFLIHQIVAKHCIGDRPIGFCVNHIDGNKQNNAPSNLEYVTLAENTKHSFKTGLHVACSPENLPSYKDGRSRDKKKYKDEWYRKNKERILEKRKEYYLENREKIITRTKEWYEARKEKGYTLTWK